MEVREPRPAATVVVVRDAQLPRAGIEVLLLRRAESTDQNGGAWVFPGGLLDPGDREPAPHASALTDGDASARLRLEQGGLAYYLAAIRECFEEAGILFAVNAAGQDASLEAESGWPAASWRHDLKQGKTSLSDLCRQFSLRLVPERLHYIAHWVTPLGRPKRFDTRFFVTRAPGDQAAAHDTIETVDHVWITPAEALLPSNQRRLMVPTRAVLETIGQFGDCAALERWAGAVREVPVTQPRLALAATGLESIRPDHPAYEEVGKLDPQGRCDAWCELRPDTPVRISEQVERSVGADGRNVYRLGSDASGWEELPPAAIRWVADDRVLIAADAAAVPPELRGQAGWLAPSHGFLQRLDQPPGGR
ncbi:MULTISPECIES: NUDIX hydrolase [Ramlibacter]|uniref:NUDIX hydrolase n=1 Tax=Ramlibacter pinisoli TaxID=2682844 RepID=A0A6N8ISV0_9BURK|nr:MULTISPECIES: NUDIX hydrolase [Ramlibacter]MBA2964942.1 NUDIX hydrolase [Ramlibacter sp. CGMCC 1.13660]MVQ29907.1 NUDIX hydrolase [Ramlibacter pinisoli]